MKKKTDDTTTTATSAELQPAFIAVPEINVTFDRNTRKKFPRKITSSFDLSHCMREIFDPGEIELQEFFVVLYLTQANKVIGYYRHSKGGIAGTVADIRIILATALKCAAVGMAICHNHPSGNLEASEQDKQLTKSLKEAAKTMNIRVLDHIILTKESYYSFSDEGLLGTENPYLLSDAEQEFVQFVERDLRVAYKHSKRSIENLARSLKITDKTDIKELTELAIVNVAREIALTPNETTHQKFEKIVQLYNDQVTLSHRTSQSILLQQYSTPAPLAFMMGVFCGLPEKNDLAFTAFEPSAGNGLLTVAGTPRRIMVNELDSVRNRNLKTQGFLSVTNINAKEPFEDSAKRYDAVLTNPPFGVLDKAVDYDSYPITVLDHLMALRALDTMKDDGRAAIIIGGHTKWDEYGRIQKGKNRIFFNYLYSHYHVLDVIQVDGHKLYSRQGTSFPVRLILIDGRKYVPQGAAPVKHKDRDVVIKSFDELYERVMTWVKGNALPQQLTTMIDLNEIKRKAAALREKLGGGLGMFEKDEDEGFTDYVKLHRRYMDLKPAFSDDILFIETPEFIVTYDEDAIRLAKIFKKTFLKSKGPGYEYTLCALSKIMLWHYMPLLSQANISFHVDPDGKPTNWKKLESEALKMLNAKDADELGAPYMPASNACVVLNTQVPDSMSFETHAAMSRIKEEVGGNIDNFVRHRLGYVSHGSLCEALSAEQIDAVAMAIYNIEARAQGTIIGDQTGIGKGRVAAAIIRYGVKRGLKPVFITEKANLFSDIYRDLAAIGSAHFRPLIINGREAKTDIKDEDGNIMYQALSAPEQQTIFNTGEIPAAYDFVVGTYSQFNSPEKKPEKPNYLRKIAAGNLFIMDEAHNSSGSSNTGEFMQGIVHNTLGVVFLSATFAKRPDNMPIYAMKTAISEANMTKDELVAAIMKGGVALQEILSSQLVAEGQMIRRERSFEGVEVNYIPLDTYEEQHRRTADSITQILRDIIAFQGNYIDKRVKELDEIAVAEGKEVEMREGTSQAGVDNQPYFSKVFNVINQMLFSIKANAVADRTVERLKEGKKPVIAFASTMGSFVEQMENDKGVMVGDGDLINLDFAEVLRRGLDGVMRYTEKDVNGQSVYKRFSVADLDEDGQKEYRRITEDINSVSTGISISPIDMIIQRLEKEGYSVAEVTGRKFSIEPNEKGNKGLVTSRKRLTTNDAFRKFNNNEVDVLMINQSGSTGASAHAIPTAKVPKEDVRQRVMIVLQAELDINTEVQKRGRINRTGQILKPIYDYVISSIPAEKRLMMMLQKKLKSLDANTTSNQKQSTKILDVPDFLNKYGDKVVQEYLAENPAINTLLGDPLANGRNKGDDESSTAVQIEDAAHKVSGRVAVLSTKMQADFYSEITDRYNDYVDYLKQIGEYDLEVEALDLKAKTLESNIIKMGKGGESAFGEDSILEKVEANILKKPFKRAELENLLRETLGGKSADEYQRELIEDYNTSVQQRLEAEEAETNVKYDNLIKDLPNEKKIKKLLDRGETRLAEEAMQEREKELNQARRQAIEQAHKLQRNRGQYMKRVLNFFTIGRKLHYPVVTFENGKENVMAISLGVRIDRKKKNPYAPSAVKISLAIANSRKYISAPASFDEFFSGIIAASYDSQTPDQDELMEQWEREIGNKTKDRGLRYVITGNLLQAFGSESGKLVSYTTADGQTRKGILMPEEWQPKEAGKQKVTVPIMKALPIISSMTNGSALYASNNVALFRTSEGYRIIVPSARSKGGAIYMDQEIWPLIEKGKFEIASDKMQANLLENNINALVEILQRKHSLSVELGHNMMTLVKHESVRYSTRKKIELPPNENDTEVERIRILKLKAKAVALRLKLAA